MQRTNQATILPLVLLVKGVQSCIPHLLHLGLAQTDQHTTRFATRINCNLEDALLLEGERRVIALVWVELLSMLPLLLQDELTVTLGSPHQLGAVEVQVATEHSKPFAVAGVVGPDPHPSWELLDGLSGQFHVGIGWLHHRVPWLAH